MSDNYIIEDLDQLSSFAKEFSQYLNKGDIILLSGEMGAGKTTFVKQLGCYLEVKDTISSPSFTLVNKYEGLYQIYHIDLYRLNNEDELYFLDLATYLEDKSSIKFIEWAEKLESLLPKSYLQLNICYLDKNKRSISFETKGENYERLLEKIKPFFTTVPHHHKTR